MSETSRFKVILHFYDTFILCFSKSLRNTFSFTIQLFIEKTIIYKKIKGVGKCFFFSQMEVLQKSQSITMKSGTFYPSKFSLKVNLHFS